MKSLKDLEKFVAELLVEADAVVHRAIGQHPFDAFEVANFSE